MKKALLVAMLVSLSSLFAVYNVGDTVADFSWEESDGTNQRTVSLNEILESGKPVIIDWSQTWCGPCQQEAPHLEELWNEYNGDIHIVTFMGDVNTFAAVNGSAWRTLFTPALTYWLSTTPAYQATYDLFGNGYIPYIVLIGKDGILKTSGNSSPTNAQIEAAIAEFPLQITSSIPDLTLSGDTHEIDLADHFNHTGGATITYSAESSDDSIVETSVSGSMLTLTKASLGVASVTVTATAPYAELEKTLTFDVWANDAAPAIGFASGLEFDGVGYVEVNNTTALQTQEMLTVSAWVKITQSGTNHGIIGKNSGTMAGWYLSIQNNDTPKFFVKCQDYTKRKANSSVALNEGEWYYIVATFDGYTPKLYINNELVGEDPYTDYSPMLIETNAKLAFGKSGPFLLKGELDNVSVWNKALEPWEIVMNKNKMLEGTEEELIAAWTLNEGFGMAAASVTSGYTGSFNGLTNTAWTVNNIPVVYNNTSSHNIYGILPSATPQAGWTFEIVDQPTYGTVVITDASTGAFTYTYDGSENDTFTYKITDASSVTSDVKTVTIDNTTVGISEGLVPSDLVLNQNYPNPFNPETTISFTNPTNGNVSLKVFNAEGKEVANLVNSNMNAGNFKVNFNAEKFQSGIYFYKLNAHGISKTKKMILIK